MSTSSSSNAMPSARSPSSSALTSSQRWQSGRAYRTSREGIEVKVVGIGNRPLKARGRGDHRGVVGAELDRDQLQGEPKLLAEGSCPPPELSVGGHSPAQRNRAPLALINRVAPRLRLRSPLG